MNAKKIQRIFFEMGEWGKIGVGYKMGSTAYGKEAVLGGWGTCSSVQYCTSVLLHSCSVVRLCCAATMLHCKIKSLRGYGVLQCNIDM